VKRFGSKYSSEHFVISALSEAAPVTQFCLQTPRKLGNSPQRNRMRRLLREFLRTHKELWPRQSAVVIETRKAFSESRLSEIVPELAEKFAEMISKDSSQ
jgi:ribonuclease P protein component